MHGAPDCRERGDGRADPLADTGEQMVSTNDLSGLPSPDAVRDAMRYSAMLDVVLCDSQWLRCYDFQPSWSDYVSMAKYGNGGGNDMFAFFRGTDAIIKGFDHESPVSPHARDPFGVWPGIYDGAPMILDELLDDPAVERDEVTFCIWYASRQWHCGTMTFSDGEDDGSSLLLGAIRLVPDSYCNWARGYYECDLDTALVAKVYSGARMESDLIAALNPDRDVNVALAELSRLERV